MFPSTLTGQSQFAFCLLYAADSSGLGAARLQEHRAVDRFSPGVEWFACAAVYCVPPNSASSNCPLRRFTKSVQFLAQSKRSSLCDQPRRLPRPRQRLSRDQRWWSVAASSWARCSTGSNEKIGPNQFGWLESAIHSQWLKLSDATDEPRRGSGRLLAWNGEQRSRFSSGKRCRKHGELSGTFCRP